MNGEETVELDAPPAFGCGDKVRAIRLVRNDGTFPGKTVGEALVSAGDVGYVCSIGTFLQRYFIYGVDFVERGRIVGMRAGELELVSPAPEPETEP
jgi:nitrogen fixation protein NifZ